MRNITICILLFFVTLAGCATGNFKETAIRTLGIECESPQDCYDKINFKKPANPRFVVLITPLSLLNLRIGKELEANFGDMALITYDIAYQTDKDIFRFDVPQTGKSSVKIENNILHLNYPWGKTINNLNSGVTYTSYKGVLTLKDKRKVIEVDAEEESQEKAYTTIAMKTAAEIVKAIRSTGY